MRRFSLKSLSAALSLQPQHHSGGLMVLELLVLSTLSGATLAASMQQSIFLKIAVAQTVVSNPP
jgi:hypothetical protein